MINTLPNIHKNEDTAYIVKDYPWGFRLRTEQRHWIETHPKRGDRHVTQTKDPRSGRWCNPKKSTYYAVMVFYLNDDGHLKSTACHQSESYDSYQSFKKRLAGYEFSPEQLRQLKRIEALNQTMKHFTFECKASPHNPINLTKVMNKDPEEMAKAEAEEKRQAEAKAHQEKVMGRMNQIFNYYMHK